MSCKHIVAALGFVLVSNADSMDVIKYKPGDAFPHGREKTERALEFLQRGDRGRAMEQLQEIKMGAPLVISSLEELDLIGDLLVSNPPIEHLLLRNLNIDSCKTKLLGFISMLGYIKQLHLENCRKTEDNPFGDSFYKAGEGLYNSRYRLPPH